MTEKLPQATPNETIKTLEKFGFIFQRQRGSHATFRHPESRRIITVPIHNKTLSPFFLNSLLKQAGINHEEWREKF
jgi:predicted RNA binding protein YcfA (HicA-like mRNA interferase family)